jgi:hypothetical protein
MGNESTQWLVGSRRIWISFLVSGWRIREENGM